MGKIVSEVPNKYELLDSVFIDYQKLPLEEFLRKYLGSRASDNVISMDSWRVKKMDRIFELLDKLNMITPLATVYKLEFRDKFSGSINQYRHGNLSDNMVRSFSNLTEAETKLKDLVVSNI